MSLPRHVKLSQQHILTIPMFLRISRRIEEYSTTEGIARPRLTASAIETAVSTLRPLLSAEVRAALVEDTVLDPVARKPCVLTHFLLDELARYRSSTVPGVANTFLLHPPPSHLVPPTLPTLPITEATGVEEHLLKELNTSILDGTLYPDEKHWLAKVADETIGWSYEGEDGEPVAIEVRLSPSERMKVLHEDWTKANRIEPPIPASTDFFWWKDHETSPKLAVDVAYAELPAAGRKLVDETLVKLWVEKDGLLTQVLLRAALLDCGVVLTGLNPSGYLGVFETLAKKKGLKRKATAMDASDEEEEEEGAVSAEAGGSRPAGTASRSVKYKLSALGKRVRKDLGDSVSEPIQTLPEMQSYPPYALGLKMGAEGLWFMLTYYLSEAEKQELAADEDKWEARLDVVLEESKGKTCNTPSCLHHSTARLDATPKYPEYPYLGLPEFFARDPYNTSLWLCGSCWQLTVMAKSVELPRNVVVLTMAAHSKSKLIPLRQRFLPFLVCGSGCGRGRGQRSMSSAFVSTGGNSFLCSSCAQVSGKQPRSAMKAHFATNKAKIDALEDGVVVNRAEHMVPIPWIQDDILDSMSMDGVRTCLKHARPYKSRHHILDSDDAQGLFLEFLENPTLKELIRLAAKCQAGGGVPPGALLARFRKGDLMGLATYEEATRLLRTLSTGGD